MKRPENERTVERSLSDGVMQGSFTSRPQEHRVIV